jgi:hypothetical protein
MAAGYLGGKSIGGGGGICSGSCGICVSVTIVFMTGYLLVSFGSGGSSGSRRRRRMSWWKLERRVRVE